MATSKMNEANEKGGQSSTKGIEEILAGKYPAQSHAHRVISYLRGHLAASRLATSTVSFDDVSKAYLYLESAKTRMNEDNDQEAPFRQRRYFYYLTGCELADSSFVWDVKAGKGTLFIPPINDDDVVWSGLPLSPEEALKKYEVDRVLTTQDLTAFLDDHASKEGVVFGIDGQFSIESQIVKGAKLDFGLLKTAIEECRVVKDAYEIALTRKANQISEIAHRAVMQAVKTAKNERELEAIFLEKCIANGCRNQAYSSIVASGVDAATLHYIKNDKPLTSTQLNLLLDAGGEYKMYAADITRTFPLQGTFTRGSASIYKLVLKMQKACIGQLKAGVLWDDVHTLAHKIAIEGLIELRILKGSPEEIFHAGTSVAFFPHGLGHYLGESIKAGVVRERLVTLTEVIGMDTHDTGGHPNYGDSNAMFRYLRVRGHLPAGSIITVEPGIYFCRFIIEPFLKNEKHAKHIDRDVLEGYWAVGGVRIEDNLLITETGYENLTTVPKELNELEKLIGVA